MATGLALALGAGQASAQTTPDQSLQDFRLDPSRDPNRPRPPEREGPEIQNSLPTAPVAPAPPVQPTVTAPVAAPPQPQPQNAPSAPAAAPRTRDTRPAPQQVPPPQPQQQTPAPEAQPERQSPAPAAEAPTTPAPIPPAPQPAPAALAQQQTSGGWIPWLIGGVLLLAGLALLILRRRSRPEAVEAALEDQPPVVDEPPAELAPPVPAPPAPPAPAPADEPRPWLVIDFEAQGVRATLVGVAVAYRLTLRNRGAVAAEAVDVAASLNNASAQQPALLAAFFNGSKASPVAHHIPRLDPGAAVELKGELRIDHGAIVPIRVQDKALMIPVVAFNALYHWAGRSGRTGAAFIVGQESSPPREKMAPFRLDQGPRQYRSVGSRPAQQPQVA